MLKLTLPTDLVVNIDPSSGIHFTYGEYMVIHCGPYNYYFDDASRVFLKDPRILSDISEAVWFNFFEHFKKAHHMDRKDFAKAAVKIFEVLGYGMLNLEFIAGETRLLLKNSAFALTHRLISGGINSPRPICQYSEGYIRAFMEHVLKKERNKIDVIESRCMAMGDKHCEFDFKAGNVNRHIFESSGNKLDLFNLPSEKLRPFLQNFDKLMPQPRNGLLFYPSIYEEFKTLYVTYMLANYYGMAFYEAMKVARENDNEQALRHLYALAAVICIVSTFGSFASTPIFKRLIYPHASNPLEAMFFLLNLAGMGRWELVSYDGSRMAYNVYNFYELNYQYQVGEDNPLSPFVEGAGMAVRFIVENMLDGIMMGEKFSYTEVLSTFASSMPYEVKLFEPIEETNSVHVVIE